MRQLTSIHQQIDHKIRIEGSRRSQELKPVCTKSAGEPILDAHFHQPQISFAVTVQRTVPIAFINPGMVRSDNALNPSLALENIFSIGLKSGLYGGRSRTLAPTFSTALMTAFDLCADKLSIMMTSPSDKVGTSSCSMYDSKHSRSIALSKTAQAETPPIRIAAVNVSVF